MQVCIIWQDIRMVVIYPNPLGCYLTGRRRPRRCSVKIDIHASCFFTNFQYIHRAIKCPAGPTSASKRWKSAGMRFGRAAALDMCVKRLPSFLRWTCVVSSAGGFPWSCAALARRNWWGREGSYFSACSVRSPLCGRTLSSGSDGTDEGSTGSRTSSGAEMCCHHFLLLPFPIRGRPSSRTRANDSACRSKRTGDRWPRLCNAAAAVLVSVDSSAACPPGCGWSCYCGSPPGMPSPLHPVARPRCSWSGNVGPPGWERPRWPSAPLGCTWSWTPHRGAFSAKLCSSAGLQSPRTQWWWALWNNSNMTERNSSPRSGRKLQRRCRVFPCRRRSLRSPCSPWRLPWCASHSTFWCASACTSQRCSFSRQGFGTSPASEGSQALHKTCRTPFQHLCLEPHGHNLRTKETSDQKKDDKKQQNGVCWEYCWLKIWAGHQMLKVWNNTSILYLFYSHFSQTDAIWRALIIEDALIITFSSLKSHTQYCIDSKTEYFAYLKCYKNY